MRTFIAIDLAGPIKNALQEGLKELARENGSIRWIKRQGMHLTLKFLGDISPGKAGLVSAELLRLVQSHSSFPMTVEGTGFFPKHGRHPRIIWAGVKESQKLAALYADMETGMTKIGFKREERPFHPHITLGRVKSPRGLQPVLEVLNKNVSMVFGTMIVAKITFFKSILKPAGAEYSIIQEASF